MPLNSELLNLLFCRYKKTQVFLFGRRVYDSQQDFGNNLGHGAAFSLQSLITDGQPNKMPTAKGCLKFYKHLSNQSTSWNRVSPIDKHMEACLFPTMLHSHCCIVVLLLGGNWGDTTFLLSVHEIVSFLQHKIIIESNSSLPNKVFCQAFYYCSKCVVTCTYLYLQFWAILPIIAHNYTLLKGRNLLLRIWAEPIFQLKFPPTDLYYSHLVCGWRTESLK